MSAEVEVVNNLPAVRRELVISPVMDLDLARSRMKEFQEFVAHYLEPSTNGGMDGDGYGSGDGDGYGYGSGEQAKEDYRQVFASSRESWTPEQKKRLAEVERECSALAFWKSDSRGLPSNGGKSKEPAFIGKVEEIKGPLSICSQGLHATMNPDKWQGERLWVVALFGEVQWDEDKCAALKREFIGEITL